MAGPQWARLHSAEPSQLRRGAWYRVVKLTPREAVLDVNGKQTPFPRATLEIVAERPQHWAVVSRPARALRLPMTWGARYGVCPNCRERARLDEHAASMRCPKCNGQFGIRWENS